MATPLNTVLAEYERASKVKELLEAKFYKVGDLCDFPLTCQNFWNAEGPTFNDQFCKTNGLDLQDQGNGTFKFVAFP